MKQFSLLIKPASADCNLHCPYCFYLDRSTLYPETKRHRMPDKVLAQMISSYMKTEQNQYAFGWQGGEPMLMGVDFFRRVTELQQKYGKNGALVANGLQTNATLIDVEFARHLAKYKFLAGVSLDGPENIHNRYRITADGRGSYTDVLRGIEHLKQNNVEFNILALVTSANVKKAREVYSFLCDMGFFYHQYIPCVEFDNKGHPMPFSINGEEWGDFLCEIFDEWIKRDTKKVSVRLFDSILTLIVDGVYNVCHMGDNCCQYFVVEHNGEIYPCDFFVESNKKLGNIMNDSWEELQNSPQYIEFGRKKALWNEECNHCEHLKYCSGDCLKHRLYKRDNSKDLSWLCKGWKQFFNHALPELKKLAKQLANQRGWYV
ncbi:MAG: anaerobic sulfatase maturase [bacterium]